MITVFGLKVDGNGVPGLPTKEAHEQAVSLFVDECAKVFDRGVVCDALRHVVVEWWDKVSPRPSTGILDTVVVDCGCVYSGVTSGNLCKVAWRGRISRSAFCHELLHIVGRACLGGDDSWHSNTLLWAEIEMSANRSLEVSGL